MIDKATVASILGIDASNIADSLFTWAQKNFYILTDLSAEETEEEYTKFNARSTLWLKLPKTNIKSVDAIYLDDESVGTITSDLVKINPRTGLIKYTGGFGTGQLVKVEYTRSAYTHLDIHDYLIALLVLKGIATFTPQYTNQIKRVKIGRYQKDLGGVEASLYMYLKALDSEIDCMVARIKGGDEGLSVGEVL